MAPISRTKNWSKVEELNKIINGEGDDWNCLDHIVWPNVWWILALHIGAGYGLYLCFASAKLLTIAFAIFLYHISLFGLTAGVHRLWSHRSYKAVLWFRVVVAICNSMAYENSIYVWSRDHRIHHKFVETNADPHNMKRGFFFAHCGWLMCKKHPDVTEFGRKIDCSDLMADPVVYYQHKYFMPSVILFCFVIPTLVPCYLWQENFFTAYFVCAILRYILTLNASWCLNSVCHVWGGRDYDFSQSATDQHLLSAVALGSGFHNFHHVFPQDYRSSEWGWKWNITAMALDCLSTFGIVYDLKTVSKDMIESRKLKNSLKIENQINNNY